MIEIYDLYLEAWRAVERLQGKVASMLDDNDLKDEGVRLLRDSCQHLKTAMGALSLTGFDQLEPVSVVKYTNKLLSNIATLQGG